MENAKKCKCGNVFMPSTQRQMRCIYCILQEGPPQLDHVRDNTTAFAEWFIYNWLHIRKAGAKAKGVPFEFDDHIVTFGEKGRRNDSTLF